ncbi:MAG: ABC transporter permease [Acidobacteriota bacterium]
MGALKQDLRYALRSLRRNPGFTTVAVLTLALGIGANGAIFTVARSVLLEALPFPGSSKVIWVHNDNEGLGIRHFNLSAADFLDIQEKNGVFESMAAVMSANFSLTGEGSTPQRVSGLQVTADYFRVYGAQPLIGRTFSGDDESSGAERVVILNHGFWQRQFGGADVLGRRVSLDGESYVVIGVMPPHLQVARDLYVPLSVEYDPLRRGLRAFTAFGRLADGTTLEAAEAELGRLAAALAADYPDTNTGWTLGADRWEEVLNEALRPSLLLLAAAVGLVLLIACVNVANLLLARMASRQREIALRGALGAGRWRLIRLFLTESVVLAVIGGGLGLLVADRATRLLVRMKADELSDFESIGVDSTVVLFTLGLSLTTGLLFGLFPALLASRRDMGARLKEGGRGQAGARSGRWARGGLVIAEVAIAVLLLVGAGLLLRSFHQLSTVDPGFDPGGALGAQLQLPQQTYGSDPLRTLRFYREVMERVRALPGVQRAAAVAPLPLIGDRWVLGFVVQGRPLPEPDEWPRADMRVSTGSYFGTMGIPLQKGRTFVEQDDMEAQRVLVVNESAAERYWPGQDPLGERVTFDNPQGEQITWWTVIGIVGDVRHQDLAIDSGPEMYLPYSQFPAVNATVLVKTATDPSVLADPLREAIAAVDPELPLFNVRTIDKLVEDSMAQPRSNSLLFGFFAGLSLLLAILGVYGVISFLVSRRVRELGVRLALGAPRESLFGLVLGQGMRPVLLGVVFGLAAAFYASRWIASQVYEVSLTDSATYGVAALAMAAVGALACVLPAVRATRVDPVIVLREE